MSNPTSSGPRLDADDEALSALLDDALPSDAAAHLRERLDREPELAARFAALRQATALVRSAYAGVTDEPLPAGVLELLRTPDGATAVRTDTVVPLRAPRSARWLPLPAAIAAGIALAVGLALGLVTGPRLFAPEPARMLAAGGEIPLGTDLYDVLQSLPSGATRTLAGDIIAAPRLTFAALDGTYCRQVDLAAAGDSSAVLACRRADGWRVEVASFAVRPADAPGGVYRPASRPPTAVDAAIDELIDGAPLAGDAELALIAAGWAR